MDLPTYDQFIDPLLRVLAAAREPLRAADAYDAVAEVKGLSREQMLQVNNSGQLTYKNRIAWAHDRLKRAGLSESPRRGYWCLTVQGSDFARHHPQALSEHEVAEIAKSFSVEQADNIEHGGADSCGTEKSPDELIDDAVGELRESLKRNLLDEIGRLSPLAFERLVLQVLHAMGFGLSRGDLEHLGKSGDEGIDGIISLDRLGLEKVYVQAKRWKSQVGSPEIQGFVGALQLKGASKGVLIAAGPISKPAQALAEKSHMNLVLIDGDRLADLMMEYAVGVNHRVIKIPEMDSDFFESEV